MCGIIGYAGDKSVVEILINGLEKLEYRGYDSAGIAINSDEEISVCKKEGKLSNLKDSLENKSLCGNVGIGHTRWATHGEANSKNAHPHLSQNKKIAVVHNGIIENFKELKDFLKKEGYKFISETDTEVIPNLIEYYYNGDLFDAFRKAVKMLKGSYALGMISSLEPDILYAVRKDSPLIVGKGENEAFIASDIPAILCETRNICFLENDEFVILRKDGFNMYDFSQNEIVKDIVKVDFSAETAEKGGYEHFLLKEIYEQPHSLLQTLRGRIFENEKLKFDNFDYNIIKDIKKIYIVACGTAYHAGLVGRYVIEKLCLVDVCVEVASEFRYRNPLVDENTLVIAVSQSGETADTLAGIRLAKTKKSKIIAITNVVGSTISREADYVFYTYAGPEISVASTKAYTTQLSVFYMIAVFIAENKKTVSKEDLNNIKKGILQLPANVELALMLEDKIKKIAEKIYNENDIYFIGRGIDYPVSMEGSLKLKEISYIHSECYAAGELKHGPIALIEKGTVVVALSTDRDVSKKTQSNIKEVKARGAYIIVIANEDTKSICDSEDEVIMLPVKSDILSPVSSVVPMQLLAYHVAKLRGNDIDKPKNLAKSVTVE